MALTRRTVTNPLTHKSAVLCVGGFLTLTVGCGSTDSVETATVDQSPAASLSQEASTTTSAEAYDAPEPSVVPQRAGWFTGMATEYNQLMGGPSVTRMKFTPVEGPEASLKAFFELMDPPEMTIEDVKAQRDGDSFDLDQTEAYFQALGVWPKTADLVTLQEFPGDSALREYVDSKTPVWLIMTDPLYVGGEPWSFDDDEPEIELSGRTCTEIGLIDPELKEVVYESNFCVSRGMETGGN